MTSSLVANGVVNDLADDANQLVGLYKHRIEPLIQ